MDAIEVSDIRRREAQLREWLGKRNGYHVDELPPHINPPTNAERSACEVFEFLRDKPERYFVYVKRLGIHDATCLATTWMGDVLGTGTLGFSYKSNMGDTRRSIWFTAITGEKYSGTYFCGAGDYARVRKVKGA